MLLRFSFDKLSGRADQLLTTLSGGCKLILKLFEHLAALAQPLDLRMDFEHLLQLLILQLSQLLEGFFCRLSGGDRQAIPLLCLLLVRGQPFGLGLEFSKLQLDPFGCLTSLVDRIGKLFELGFMQRSVVSDFGDLVSEVLLLESE